jgi:fatty-acyl-CoA synthase
VGLAYPTNEIRVVNDRDEDVSTGEVGELVYNGYTRMKSYYKDPEATQEAMKGGWMHSGDLAKLDEEGYVYLVGRKKEMIVTGGENVYSREVEEAIIKLPQVAEVAVIGLPDPKWGEAVTAVVVLKQGARLSGKEVIAFCKNHIASYKSPKRVIFAESLPKNSVGKILKRELKRSFGT